MSVDSETASTPPADAVGVVIADLVRKAYEDVEKYRNLVDHHRTTVLLSKNKLETVHSELEKARAILAQVLEVQAWAVPS